MADPIELPAPDADTAKRWQDVMRTLRTGVNSDFLIKCGEDAHAVHKNIISAHSEVLSRACNGPFKEAMEGVLTLVDDDPLAVTAMIDYIYLGNYTHTIMKPPDDIESNWVYAVEFLPLHAKVYLLGDRYGLQGLQKTATANAIETMKSSPDCPLSDEFKATIDIAYSQACLDNCCDFRGCLIDAMIKHHTCLDDEKTECKIRQHPAMSYELGSKLRKDFNLIRLSLRCQYCSQTLHLTSQSDVRDIEALADLCSTVFSTRQRHTWAKMIAQ